MASTKGYRNVGYEVRGNTVLAPQHNPYTEEKYKQKVSKQPQKKTKTGVSVKVKKKVLSSILGVFVTGTIMIGLQSQVYSLQTELNSMNREIKAVGQDNEALKLILLETSSIDKIKDVSVNKLHMAAPGKDQVIYVDMTKDYFASATPQKEENLLEKALNQVQEKIHMLIK